MHARRALPITTVLLILALALATVGVGYGLWSKVLTIEGRVETGEVNARFTIEEIDEGDPRTSLTKPVFWEGDSDCDADGASDDDCEWELKDVAECTAQLISDSPPDLPNPGPQLLRVRIVDGYPSYNCWVQFDLHNNGSIPIRVHRPVIKPVNFINGVQVTVRLEDGNHGPTPDNDSVCYHTPAIVPFPGDTGHPQLEPGDVAYCVIHVHVEQPAEQNKVYEFTASICAHQWNEEPGDPEACTP